MAERLPASFIEEIWEKAEEAIAADPNIFELRTARRAGFAVAQTVALAYLFADGTEKPVSGGEYTMPDYEADHGRIPTGGPTKPGDPNAPLPPDPTGTGPIPNNAYAIVAAVRLRYPTPLGRTCVDFLRQVARSLGPEAGLLEKTTGNNVDGYATDIICFRSGDIFDVLVDSDRKGLPAWQYAGKVDPSRWRAP
jgi:hypothetical protein